MIQEESQVKITVNDLIYANVQDLGKRMDRLENRLDKVEVKLEKLSERIDKQDEKFERLADKIDNLRRDLNVGTNHYQILLATLGGVFLTTIFFLLKG